MRPAFSTACATMLICATAPAQFSPFGSGCRAVNNSLMYELFPPGTFDMNSFIIDWLPNGAGNWNATAGGASLFPYGSGTSVDVGATDDSVTGPFALPFTFNYPGGSTTQIEVSSNGYVHLQVGNADDHCCDGAAGLADMMTQPDIFAAFGMDLNPSAGGSVWFDDGSAVPFTVAYVTWDNVPEFGTASTNTFQLQLYPTFAAMVWSGCANVFRSAVVGWTGTPGPDNGGLDFTNWPNDGGDGTVTLPLALETTAVPFGGTLFDMDLANVPAAATFGTMMFGDIPTAFDLDFIGLETCDLLTNANVISLPVSLTPPTGALSWAISSSFTGLTFVLQAAVIAPGTTTLGVLTSNGASVTIL